MLKGIDLSAHNGTQLDFNYIKDNFDFVICKAGGQEDQGFTYYTHGTFQYHRAGISNLKRGWYWFNGNKGTPTGGGNYFGDLMNNNNIPDSDILVLDIEDFSNGSAWTPAMAVDFFTALKAKRPNSPLYAYMNASMERTRNWTPLINMGVRLWIAAYGVNNGFPNTPPVPRYWPQWHIWQYTDKGCITENCVAIGNTNTGLDVNLAELDAFSSGLRPPSSQEVHSNLDLGHLVKVNGVEYIITDKGPNTLELMLKATLPYIEAVNEPLYYSSLSKRPSRNITGQYWFWDDRIVNGRRRITNHPRSVGKPGQITGWIEAEKGK